MDTYHIKKQSSDFIVWRINHFAPIGCDLSQKYNGLYNHISAKNFLLYGNFFQWFFSLMDSFLKFNDNNTATLWKYVQFNIFLSAFKWKFDSSTWTPLIKRDMIYSLCRICWFIIYLCKKPCINYFFYYKLIYFYFLYAN